ncbi:hypothetical protein SAMN04488029_2618 [Reichenbachiella faecimaris]|uniref:YbbR-like protein n=1 Tax=Reichenbachiella faecimaris TaxID=692418 RepID=A0A1W2GH02_REIFA|nr:hypothetical protein [Reichenbachiella faecimaris]SMD35939.1 hypothetical protein SAMN04488029_2618 [Reichenbachiella faecimaris]
MGIFRFLLPGLKDNWKVVVLSILGATTFWFFNAMNKSYDTRVDYPLSYTFAEDSVVVINPLAKQIKIDVTSGGWNLIRKTLRINATPINIPLDNPTEIKFLTRSSLIPMISDQLDGLRLIYVVTDTLFFNIEEKITKKLPVYIDSISIPLSQSYRMVSPISCSVDSAWVSGPKSTMMQMPEYVQLDFSNMSIDGNFDEELRYFVGEHVRVQPAEATVKFQVAKYLAREISLPIELLDFPQDSSAYLTDSNIVLYYTIKEDDEDEVSASDFSVTADYSMRNMSDSTVVPILMYAHEKALDIVLASDRIKLTFAEPQ